MQAQALSKPVQACACTEPVLAHCVFVLANLGRAAGLAKQFLQLQAGPS